MYHFLKRILDFVLALVCIISFSFIILFIGFLIFVLNFVNPFFIQKRVGKSGREFMIVKFRTMDKNMCNDLTATDLNTVKISYLHLGKFLRKTGLDELPQLFNILKGDMSFVGPRPLIIKEKFMHEKRNEAGVYNLRPGLTGLAQISCRSSCDDKLKLKYDIKYLKIISFVCDCKIIFKTIGVMFVNERNKD